MHFCHPGVLDYHSPCPHATGCVVGVLVRTIQRSIARCSRDFKALVAARSLGITHGACVLSSAYPWLAKARAISFSGRRALSVWRNSGFTEVLHILQKNKNLKKERETALGSLSVMTLWSIIDGEIGLLPRRARLLTRKKTLSRYKSCISSLQKAEAALTETGGLAGADSPQLLSPPRSDPSALPAHLSHLQRDGGPSRQSHVPFPFGC